MKAKENIKLFVSPVVYDRGAHTYTLDGKPLKGITAMLRWQLHPDQYGNVPPEVLKRAAEKGSNVHDLCETWDNFKIEADDPHLRDYIALTEGLKYEMSEYVVTDGEHFASPIDKVWRVNYNTFDIGDIKTTSTMDDKDIEKVTWQTSIYAYWLEKMNAGCKVRNLYVVWLPDERYQTSGKKPMLKKLKRIAAEEVEKLLQAEINGLAYREDSVPLTERDGWTPTAKTTALATTDIPEQVAALNTYVLNVLAESDRAAKAKEEMMQTVREAMEQCGMTKWTTEAFTFSITADSVRRTLDAKALAAKYPDVANDNEIYKETAVKGSFRVTTK